MLAGIWNQGSQSRIEPRHSNVGYRLNACTQGIFLKCTFYCYTLPNLFWNLQISFRENINFNIYFKILHCLALICLPCIILYHAAPCSLRVAFRFVQRNSNILCISVHLMHKRTQHHTIAIQIDTPTYEIQ